MAQQTIYQPEAASDLQRANTAALNANFTELYGSHTVTGNLTVSGQIATTAAAPTIASGSTIAPSTRIAFVSGTTTISIITAPAGISSTGGQITLIPTGLWSTNTAGNIALATTAVVSKALVMTYDSGTGKWYPSY